MEFGAGQPLGKFISQSDLEIKRLTSDRAKIVAYDGEPRVKVGREFLLKKD